MGDTDTTMGEPKVGDSLGIADEVRIQVVVGSRV